MSSVRERHVPLGIERADDLTEYECATCEGVLWPCDAIQMADERDAAINAAERKQMLLDAARADADRLAELVRLWRSIAACREYPPSVEVQEQTREALGQHDIGQPDERQTHHGVER